MPNSCQLFLCRYFLEEKQQIRHLTCLVLFIQINACNGLGHFLLSPNTFYPFFSFWLHRPKAGLKLPRCQKPQIWTCLTSCSQNSRQKNSRKQALAPCSLFPSLSAGGSQKVGRWAVGPQGSGWGCQCRATTFPLPGSLPAWLAWLLQPSRQTQPPHFPPAVPSRRSGAAGVMECLCLSLFSPRRPHCLTDEGKKKKFLWGDTEQMNFCSINHFRETIDSRTFECIDPFIKVSSSLVPCALAFLSTVTTTTLNFLFLSFAVSFLSLFFHFDPIILS